MTRFDPGFGDNSATVAPAASMGRGLGGQGGRLGVVASPTTVRRVGGRMPGGVSTGSARARAGAICVLRAGMGRRVVRGAQVAHVRGCWRGTSTYAVRSSPDPRLALRKTAHGPTHRATISYNPGVNGHPVSVRRCCGTSNSPPTPMSELSRNHPPARTAPRGFVSKYCIVGLMVAAGMSAGAVQVWSVVGTAAPSAPVLFDHGLTALDPGQIDSKWTNEACQACHEREFAQWHGSRHHRAATNDSFREQLLTPGDGRKQWCINCHAPINAGAKNLPTQEPSGLDGLYHRQPTWLRNGVDCLACHVRGDEILATRATAAATRAHPIRIAPELGTAEFCAGCHQFSSHSDVFPDSLSGELQQASLEEFLEQQAGARCHDCHLLDGDHRMAGGYDKQMLAGALDLGVSAEWNEELRSALVSVEVSVGHVGHRVPGGEHFFRYLTLQTTVEGKHGVSLQRRAAVSGSHAPGTESAEMVDRWPRIEFLGHKMGTFEKHFVGEPNPDSRLSPGETRAFRYLVPVDAARIGSVASIRTQLWYHLLDKEKARSLGLSVDDTRWIVAARETELTLGANE